MSDYDLFYKEWISIYILLSLDPLPCDIVNPINSREDAKQTMKKLLSHGDVNKEHMELLMNETFAERRNFITVTCPPVAVVHEQYPALFCAEQVCIFVFVYNKNIIELYQDTFLGNEQKLQFKRDLCNGEGTGLIYTFNHLYEL